MSQEGEKIKKIMDFKKKLETGIEETKSKLEELESTLDAVNSILLKTGFKRAEITRKAETPSEKKEEEAEASLEEMYEMVQPLKTVAGDTLADLHIGQDSLRVIMAQDKEFSINTPPFTQFLVDRVLKKMREKDYELSRAGKIASEGIFSYNIIEEDGRIHEILINNADSQRVKELRSSIRWTLEKMLEKT